MPDVPSEVLQWVGTVAAVIAAVVGIFVAVWNVTRDVRDAGKLRIDFVLVLDSAAARAGNAESAVVPCCRITNIGRQPIMARGIHITLENSRGQLGWDHRNLPRLLQPSDVVVEPFHSGIIRPTISGLFVEDSRGKPWRASRKVVKQLREASDV